VLDDELLRGGIEPVWFVENQMGVLRTMDLASRDALAWRRKGRPGRDLVA